MRYGYFDDEHREYVITDPRTPVKWINYVGTLAFGGIVDHTGGALICRQDPALNRITKYIPQLPDSDFKGATLYLRLKREGGYQVFSPYFVPTLAPYDRYACHIGLGYVRIVSEFYGLRTEATIFVPPREARLITDIRISNVSGQTLAVDIIPVVEYTHPDALKQLTNADWVPQTMQSRAHREAGGFLTLTQYPFMYRGGRFNFLTSNHPVSSFESDRRRFLRDNEGGTWAHPLSLQAPELGNSEALRGDNIGALLHHMGEIQPGQTVRLIVQLGQADSLDAALPAIHRYRDAAHVDKAFAEMAAFWEGYLATLHVETPSSATNRMLNIHTPRQCHTTLNWSRYLSLYQLGLGSSRGIGFRDTAQDMMGTMSHAPAEGKRLLRLLLSVQKRDGSAMHQFNPLTMVADEGDSREVEGAPRYYSDDHLWAILATAAYLRETGDLAFLEERISYYDKDRQGQPLEYGTVLDHLQRALAFTRQNTGAHGLPLLGFADWNDTVNLRAGAESVFAAELYGKALLDMIELLRHLGDVETAARYAADYETTKQRVNETAWDGEWYAAYFDADGSPLGSQSNSAGQIHTNAQSWAVISGFAPPERARAALDAVYRRLNTARGIKLCAPAYDGFDPAKGGVTTYPPGAKENGGIFLHANPWVMIAEVMMGNGERAFAYYEQINPAAQNDRADEFECEPYVYPQNILGDEHPQFGLARNSWLTGTASWAYQAATQYILGIRPTYAGLMIAPCIPAAWDGFQASRRFRGAVYEIAVENPQHVCCGVQSITVDGRHIEGNILPAFADGRAHRVRVTLG